MIGTNNEIICERLSEVVSLGYNDVLIDMKCFLLFLIIAVVYAVLRKTVGRQQRRLLILADVGLTIAFSILILKSLVAPFLVTALSLLPISAIIGTPLLMDATWSPIPSMDSPNLEPLPVGDTSGHAVPATNPANPSTAWLSERVQLWSQTANLSPTPDWAKSNIENHGGYAQVFDCNDWRIIAEPTGRPLQPENIFVVFRNGGFCEASLFISSDIPDEGDAINHLTWSKQTLRVSAIFGRQARVQSPPNS